jgi:hypothetical protein
MTDMSVMFAVLTTPDPSMTTHVCAGVAGCIATVTEYEAPLLKAAGNVKDPDAGTETLPPSPFRRIRPWPASPATVPPIV